MTRNGNSDAGSWFAALSPRTGALSFSFRGDGLVVRAPCVLHGIHVQRSDNGVVFLLDLQDDIDDAMTTTILIIYAVGVIINALAAASIYDDLKQDGQLLRVRLVALVFFVLASFGTWLYMIGYLLVKLFKSIFKGESKDGKEKT